MSDQFQIVNKFAGYLEHDDITNIPPNHLVIGSQNVTSKDGRRIGNRMGYTLYGQANATLAGIESSYDWYTHRGFENHLRSFDDTNSGGSPTLQFLYLGLWYDLIDGLNRASINYAEFWSNVEEQDVLIFVDGSTTLYEWGGGITTFASATATTITKQGTTSWAEDGFFQSGVRQVTIDGIVYTYTGGEQTTVLTGVTPDPTLGGHIAGDIIVQTVRQYPNTPIAPATVTANTIAFVNSNPDTITRTAGSWITDGFIPGMIITVTGSVSNNRTYTISTVTALTLTLVVTDVVTAELAGTVITIISYSNWTNDLVTTVRNQLYVGSFISREVQVSKVGFFYDFAAPSVPRVVGEAALLVFDSTPVAFIVQEDVLYVSAGLSDWYTVQFQLSADLTDESIIVTHLKTAALQGAISQAGVFKMKNDIVFVSKQPTFDSIGRIELVNTPQSVPFSDPVENMFERLDFTGCAGKFYGDNLYIAVPANNITLIYNSKEAFWEPPQVLPFSCFSIIQGQLYGHSLAVPETYKMNEGFNDNGNPIAAIAAFAYQNYGVRTDKKVFQEWYTEGYIQENSILYLQINYDYKGASGQQIFEAPGDCSNIIFNPTEDGSLGKFSLGKANLGGSEEGVDETLPPKFRIINTTVPIDFYECQPIYYSNELDYRWEILAIGPQVYKSTSDNNWIKDCIH